jgi:integrase
MREAIDLGEPEILPSGKVRWQKSHKKNKWKSPSYDQDSRRNRSEAWAFFVVWRDEIDANLEAQQEQADNDHPLRKDLVNHLKEEIDFAQASEDSKQEKWATDVLAIVRKEDAGNLEEINSLLGLNAEDYEFAESQGLDAAALDLAQRTARTVVQSVVKAKRKKEIKTSELVAEWLKVRLVDIKTGDLSAGGYTNIKRQVERWERHCPNILNANALKLEVFKSDLKLSDMAKRSQRDYLSTAKAFLEWCSDIAEVIPPIKGLRKRGSGIKIPKKQVISIWEDEDIKDLFDTVKGQMRLELLLMLNTGAYESDIGNWTKTAVDDQGKKFTTFDMRAKTIRFKRHKEKDVEEVPTVTYRLWDETYNLLCEHEAEHESLLLTTSTNTSLWSRSLDPKTLKLKAKSTIGKNYRALRKKLSKENWGTLDDLRKTAASKLRSHTGQFAKFTQYFAGHAPEGTTDSFYVKPEQQEFDEAVIWLGHQFGFCSS